MNKLFITTTITLALWTMTVSQQVAADERMGVATLEEKQRRQAIVAAQVGGNQVLTPDTTIVINDQAFVSNSQPSEIERNISSSLDPMSLEEGIQKQVVQSSLELFGYEMFSGVANSFAPITGAPVPQDYLIGPGDTFTVQAFSAADVQ